MDIVTAENIGKKSKALRHCDKLLKSIEKNGSTKIKLNCTGVEFIVRKDDAIYLRIQATKYSLLNDIKSYELTTRSTNTAEQSIRRTAPAPVGAAPESEIILDTPKKKKAEYNRRYYQKRKAKILNHTSK